ncbi:S-adenosyl-L-methionine-dependent methyltransferase [Cylindrobasidium torrendii FP15055 ss-10]|uniref:S-adenosyl-L-methionine-dependent methyltransferase n=1 Tax=Cylindrobasidium torrendii FP15055 ss-10 TaxID=1314674 RepID=A0A0D7BV53_9AGAR|nr:S-adenosyl-L-methionine-dependent methyltransferase [Cylindrobasidium torrendii FP15055 ss-10]
MAFSSLSSVSIKWDWTTQGVVLVGVIWILALLALGTFTPQLRFIWHCFLAPIGASDQKSRLDKFYEGQAQVYDSTRNGLLRGRNTMLNLSAAHLRELRKQSSGKRLVWIDIGGGTGWNIEQMDKHFPISEFDHVYLIDLCGPLLQVARTRFARRGWKNVTVLCQDATEFCLPEWSEKGMPSEGSVSFVTMSYSLSMIPNYYALLDRIEHVLDPAHGLLGVADFYTAGKQPSLHEKAIGGVSKEVGWVSRWFWQIWFDFDHVSLSPARRAYLEYRFGTVKSYNGRNRFILPFIVRIPYYVWIGRPRSCDVSRFCHAFEVEGGNIIGNCSPTTPFKTVATVEVDVPKLEIGESALALPTVPGSTKPSGIAIIDVTPPLSSFHYQVQNRWRLPYYDNPIHKDFRTFIYSFTWEDPMEDMKHLRLSSQDSMFVITSAGDNALHYAVNARPKRIHCVDMNPCQGHLLELKLACVRSLGYDDFFLLFGCGRHSNFRQLLDSKIAPHLSSVAYQFWHINADAFASGFYLQGYSGWALRFAQFVFKIAGVSQRVVEMCQSENLEDQVRIWRDHLRPVLLNPIVVELLKSPVFCWNALGVPMNQRQMLLDEGGVYQYVVDTLDPVVSTYLLRTDNYFYLLALMGHYTSESCPAYLTRAGFETLKAQDGACLDSFRLHTEPIVNVLRGLAVQSLTRSLVMDHLDWFVPGDRGAEEEVIELRRATAQGGMVFWRSASRVPWYNEVFKRHGFRVEPVSIRQTGAQRPIDRVNMYASFWKAKKI